MGRLNECQSTKNSEQRASECRNGQTADEGKKKYLEILLNKSFILQLKCHLKWTRTQLKNLVIIYK